MSLLKSVQLSKNEHIKRSDPTLAGGIAETLANPAADRFSEDDEQFLKFHGIYQQDDRDKRKIAKQFIFMIRARITGGIVPAAQYLAFDEIADKYANKTIRVTSRQTFQWHGVVKQGLGHLVRGLNEALCTTIAACGDINRNVMAPATPATSPLVERVHEDARRVTAALLPATEAYHRIWMNGEPLKMGAGEKQSFADPLYGQTYLPRKFKIAFAIPPLNDTDIFSNCLGFVAIANPEDPAVLLGYNVLCGGGMAMSHGNKETFPRMADVLGFTTPDRLVAVARAVVLAYRDTGDRTNRKHARLKYVLADRGAEWFRGEVESHAGFALEPAREAVFTHQGDLFGWNRQADGRWFLGLYVETGRIKDEPGRLLKTGLRQAVATHGVEVRLTPSQNVILANVRGEQKAGITDILAEHGIPVENQASAIRRSSMACPAMPTCGLALAESERVMPGFLDRFEALLSEVGAPGEDLVVRMTGCPNGCARPYLAEIGIVGRMPGKYHLYLGGNGSSTRMNREYRPGVKFDDIIGELRPVLLRWRSEGEPGERFGDFAARIIWPEQEASAAPVSVAAS